MIWSTLMKKPMLGIGIIMILAVAYQSGQKGKWGIFKNSKLNPTSCSAVLIKLNKEIPGNWQVFCEGNNLAVEIIEQTEIKKEDQLRPMMYRQLANHMVYTVQHSMPDILAKVNIVRFRLTHSKMIINAITTGDYIVKLETIKEHKYILDHLQSTVKVKETLK